MAIVERQEKLTLVIGPTVADQVLLIMEVMAK